MDCAVIPLARYQEYSLVQTVDFFYPLVDDPVIMGQIALANVVSDVYAVGVTELDKLNMLITAPTKLTEQQNNILLPLIIKGFKESAKSAGVKVNVRSVCINPWCIIGGIATAVVKRTDVIMPSNAQAGDVIVLTKPLGTQLATNAYIWLQESNEKYQQLLQHFDDNDIQQTYEFAVKSMTFLNKNAAQLMHKYNAHAATDVTGFGLLGHAQNLVEFQKATLTFELHTLPIIKNVLQMAEVVGQSTKLRAGKAVETSGGLLICLSAECAAAFCEDFRGLCKNGQNAWIVGRVLKSDTRHAQLSDNMIYLDVKL